MPRKRASDGPSQAEEPNSSTATRIRKVTWRLHFPGASNPPVASAAGTDFAASGLASHEQEDDFAEEENQLTMTPT